MTAPDDVTRAVDATRAVVVRGATVRVRGPWWRRRVDVAVTDVDRLVVPARPAATGSALVLHDGRRVPLDAVGAGRGRRLAAAIGVPVAAGRDQGRPDPILPRLW